MFLVECRLELAKQNHALDDFRLQGMNDFYIVFRKKFDTGLVRMSG